MQVENEAAESSILGTVTCSIMCSLLFILIINTPPQGPPQSASPFLLKTVTKTNFEASLTGLRHHVRASDFVAIDLEMTGVASAPWCESFEFDRSDVGYLKVWSLREQAKRKSNVEAGEN